MGYKVARRYTEIAAVKVYNLALNLRGDNLIAASEHARQSVANFI
jgi:hypothetical protein